jgi:RAD51-like protein 3
MSSDGDSAGISVVDTRHPYLASVHGIPAEVVARLAKSRVCDVQSLLAWPEAELCRVTDLDRATVRAACAAVHSQYAARRQSAVDIDAAAAALSHSTLQCRYPNAALRERSPQALCGARPGDLVELVGVPSSGKTQVCLTAAASVASAGRGVVLLDSSAALDVERVYDILRACGLDEETASLSLKNILVIPVGTLAAAEAALTALVNDIMTVKAMWGALERGEDQSREKDDAWLACDLLADVGLIVFDSPSSLLSPALGCKWSDGWTGYASSNHISCFVRRLAVLTNAPVLMTNRRVKGGRDSEQQRAALGRSWSYVPDVRVYLEPHTSEGGRQGLFLSRRIQSKRERVSSATLLCVDACGVGS